MREIIIHSQRTVKATDPEIYDELMNDALNSIKEVEKIIDLSTERFFCSIIRYAEKTKEYESEAEKCWCEGYRHKCGECKLFPSVADNRTRWRFCEHADGGMQMINKDIKCCRYFIEQHLTGNELLKGGEANDD